MRKDTQRLQINYGSSRKNGRRSKELQPEPVVLDITEVPALDGERADGEGIIDPELFLDAMYLWILRSSELISADEEKRLGCLIQEKARELEKHAQNGELSAEQKAELQAVIVRGDEAKKQLVEANLRLVIDVAKMYAKPTVKFIDLVQQGNIGLLKAAEYFDPTKGFRFSTYATWWIRAEISRYAKSQERTVRLPLLKVDLLGQIERVRREFLTLFDRLPTFEEIAVAVGLDDDEGMKVLQSVLNASDTGSLDENIEESSGEAVDPLIETIADPQFNGAHTLDELIISRLKRPHFQEVLNDLLEKIEQEEFRKIKERENRRKVQTVIDDLAVFCYRFGMYDGEVHTLEETGAFFGGRSKEWANQAAHRILEALVEFDKENTLREFWEEGFEEE